MRAALRLVGAIDVLNDRVGRAAAWLLLPMVLLAAGNATVRYTSSYTQLNLASNTWIELQWYLFALVFLLVGPRALALGDHVRVDVLYTRLGRRQQVWLDLLGGLFLLLPFTVTVLYTSLPSVWNAWLVREMSPDPGGLPRYPIKAAVMLAFLLLGLQGLAEVVKRIAYLAGHDGVLGAEEEAP
jgi:TRAP-type mannitol/chloroaromatic compound transport system permease small subunit